MTTLGNYNTDVSDMYAVHNALTGALDSAPVYVGKADGDLQRVEVIVVSIPFSAITATTIGGLRV